MLSTRMTLRGALLASALLTSAAGAALATTPDTMKATPRFVVLPATSGADVQNGGKASALTTWPFSYTYNSHQYTDTFVGNAPPGKSVTTPTFIIPLKIVLSTGQSFTTSTTQPNGQTALADTIASPIFQKISFKEAGTNLGKTQYEDAYMRESFWPLVLTNKKYHDLLGQPTVLPEVTLNVPAAQGKIGTEFGVQVALVNINYIDQQVHSIIQANSKITGGSVPIFEMYNTYETSGGCCIGGYHSASGAQTYSVFDYIGTSGAKGVFGQDVSALSHEMAEWFFDPFVNNNSPCGIYEVGDPLERESNYGGYPYTSNGMTYNLQDEAQPPYFGAPPATSLDSRFTFQGTTVGVCANGS